MRKIAIVGPTASGKTAVGIALAQLLDGEIVNADSMQVYRGMNIGTAKPTEIEQAAARFHLIDVAEPDENWTLADFKRAANASIEDIQTRKKTPVIVGGTGLYIRALTTNLDIPAAPPDEEFREKWRDFARENGSEKLQAKLAKIDPESAKRIHVNDIGRQIRALEVRHQTGKTLTELHAENQALPETDDTQIFGLNFQNRAELYARIEARVDAMVENGFLDEVRRLKNLYGRDVKPMQSLGYKQLAAHLDGELTFDDAVDETKRQTRHFARRQLVWFRAEKRIHWLDMDAKTPDDIAQNISFLLKA